MLRTVDLTDLVGDYRAHIPRAALDVAGAMDAVREVCDAVRERGTEALAEYSHRFDGVVPATFRVPERVLVEAAEQLDPKLREAFEESIRRRRVVAETLECDTDPAPVVLAEGARVGLRNIPVERVGLYVPGGLAPLASSVIMNVVPAQVAGVREIAVASPPQAGFGGWPHPNILALCHMLGVEEVYAVGGAQAIAMFAYGVAGLCAPVAMVTGPGNIYVVAAKRLAEHDPMAASVLITDSPELSDLVAVELGSQVAATKHRKRIRTALTGQQSAVLLVRDLDQAVDVADAYAAEHLEIQTRDAGKVAARINNAGAIFVGNFSPVSLGDYSAGSTHVLPTAGCACHGSGLTVRSFMRTVHVIDYSVQALSDIADGIERFALAEDLPGHAAAITVRTRR